MASIALCLGRFQPFHNGHFALIQKALQEADWVIVGIGSAWRPRTPRNPLSWQERAELIRVSFSALENERIRLMPLRDYFDVARWCRALHHRTLQLADELSNGESANITLWSRMSAPAWARPDLFSNWGERSLDRHGHFDGNRIRNLLFQATCSVSDADPGHACVTRALNDLAEEIPDAGLQWLHQHLKSPLWQQLGTEWQTLGRIREAWRDAPFPPVFVTVDSVVRCQNHVLLIRRDRPPGAGLLALPGGFVEGNETLLHAAMRELSEETHIDVCPSDLSQSLRDFKVFDHPDRSLFGRVITHGHYFEFEKRPLPAIKAADDARSAQWMPIEKLSSFEDQFHDDHFFILDHFLSLLPPIA